MLYYVLQASSWQCHIVKKNYANDDNSILFKNLQFKTHFQKFAPKMLLCKLTAKVHTLFIYLLFFNF